MKYTAQPSPPPKKTKLHAHTHTDLHTPRKSNRLVAVVVTPLTFDLTSWRHPVLSKCISKRVVKFCMVVIVGPQKAARTRVD